MKTYNTFFIIITLSLVFPSFFYAEGCPEIGPPLQNDLETLYPTHAIADGLKVSDKNNTCPQLINIGSKGYVITLRKKGEASYLLLFANMLNPGTTKRLVLLEIDQIDHDLPVISKAQRGLFKDIDTNKTFTVSRDSLAISATFPVTGKQFIYKLTDRSFVQYRVN